MLSAREAQRRLKAFEEQRRIRAVYGMPGRDGQAPGGLAYLPKPSFDCSPVSESIVLAAGKSGMFDLFVLKPSTMACVPLTQTDTVEFYPSYSPDGMRIAFARSNAPDTPSSIWIMNQDGTGELRLTHAAKKPAPNALSEDTRAAGQNVRPQFRDTMPTFVDADTVAFLRGSEKSMFATGGEFWHGYTLHAVTISTAKVREIEHEFSGNPSVPLPFPHLGDTLRKNLPVSTLLSPRGDTFLVDPAAGAWSVLEMPEGWSGHAFIESPQGDAVYFISYLLPERDKGFEISVAKLEGKALREPKQMSAFGLGLDDLCLDYTGKLLYAIGTVRASGETAHTSIVVWDIKAHTGRGLAGPEFFADLDRPKAINATDPSTHATPERRK